VTERRRSLIPLDRARQRARAEQTPQRDQPGGGRAVAEAIRDTECQHLRRKGIGVLGTAYELHTPDLWEVRRLCNDCAADRYVVQSLMARGFHLLGEKSTKAVRNGESE
jgi:hypothetical protein